MAAANVREASARVIAALQAAGRSKTTIKRHEAEFRAFARFLDTRGHTRPTEAACLDFVVERSGCRLADLREPTSSRPAQLARRPLILLMECLDGSIPGVGQATTPLVDRCPARFRAARDEYLAACRVQGNAEASVVTKHRAADQFLAYLDEVGRTTLDQAQARHLAGFCGPRQRRGYGPKTTGTMRSALAYFLRHLHQAGQIREGLAQRLPPQRYPRRDASAPYLWTAEDVRLVLDQIDRQSSIGKRDYALVLLTARLGLRVGDLRRLELGWFDWRAKTLALTQHKTGVPLTLPLPGDVGWSVIDYIRHGRPDADCPQVFVKHRYPFTAFGSSTSAGCPAPHYPRRGRVAVPVRRPHGPDAARRGLGGV